MTPSKTSPRIGDSPPPLLLRDVIQGPVLVDISWEKLKGQVVVLEFWDTRCSPCVQAIPHWNALVEEFRSKPVVFLGISKENKDFLSAFLEKKPVKGWLALDQAFSPTRSAFGVVGVPTTVIVNPSGKIAAITHPAELEARHLEEILEGKPSTLPVEPDLPARVEGKPKVLPESPTAVQVSIRGPFPQPDGPFGFRGWKKPDLRFIAKVAELQDVLAAFYEISPHMVIGNEELPEGLYDITAVAPPHEKLRLRAEFEEALKRDLGITVAQADRETEVYAMTVCASNAPGLKPASKAMGGSGRPGGFSFGGLPLKAVAGSLEGVLGKPVVDETGLTGLWATDINWEMSQSEFDTGVPDPEKVIEAARDQLGLELKRVKRILPALVVRKHPTGSL